MLYTVIYISRATKEMSEDLLEDILSISRKNNLSTGISGMLLYKNGEFMQALEGEKEVVLKLMNKIAGDARHSDILTLSRKAIPHRYFKNWSMGFENLTGVKKPGQFDTESFFSSSFKQSDTAHNFLREFYTN